MYYVSKWIKGMVIPRTNTQIMLKFKKIYIFSRFRIPRVLISNRGSYFFHKRIEVALFKYGIHHRITITYHPQTSGQAKNSNRDINRILKKTINYNKKDYFIKLDDAL